MNKTLLVSILFWIQLCSFVIPAKERKLRIIPMNTNDVVLTPGISCIQIESTITCYGVNANRSVLHFINKATDIDTDWSSWYMIVLEDPSYDVKLDGISCVNRNNMPKCYLRMTNLGFEHLIEINPLKETWYQLCDHLATKPLTMIIEEKNVNIISRTIKNEFYHKYVDVTWHINKKSIEKNEFTLIGEASCVLIDDNSQIICFSRTDDPTRLVIWSRRENSLEFIENENENENNIKFSSDLSCISTNEDKQTKIVCFVVNQDENIYGMLCHYNINEFICSKWILINSKINSFKKIKPISFVYLSSNNLTENLVLYALTNDGLPYITTCQQCIYSIQNWNKQWADWMELTSKSLSSIESIFNDFQKEKIFIIGLTDHQQFTFSTFDYQNHIPSPFQLLNDDIYTYIM